MILKILNGLALVFLCSVMFGLLSFVFGVVYWFTTAIGVPALFAVILALGAIACVILSAVGEL